MSGPVLNERELEGLLSDPQLKSQVLPTFFDIHRGVEGSLKKGLLKLCEAADEAVRNGSQVLVLSDRSDNPVHTSFQVYAFNCDYRCMICKYMIITFYSVLLLHLSFGLPTAMLLDLILD